MALVARRGSAISGVGCPAGAWAPRRGVACRAAAETGSLLRGVSDEVTVTVVEGTGVVSEAARRHQTSPTATAALGRALLGGTLLTTFKGEGEGTCVRFKGTGPLGSVTVIAEDSGMVKGAVGNPRADPPLRPEERARIGCSCRQGCYHWRAGAEAPYTFPAARAGALSIVTWNVTALTSFVGHRFVDGSLQ